MINRITEIGAFIALNDAALHCLFHAQRALTLAEAAINCITAHIDSLAHLGCQVKPNGILFYNTFANELTVEITVVSFYPVSVTVRGKFFKAYV